MEDPLVQDRTRHWPFKLVNVHGRPYIEVEYRGHKNILSPEQILSKVLAKLKMDAEAHLKTHVKHVVVTVPSHYGFLQRYETMQACKYVDLTLLSVIDEPSAAALMYMKLRREHEQPLQNFLVYSLGGGSCQVAYFKVFEGWSCKAEACAGDRNVGGEEFDNRILAYCIDEIKRRHNKDPSSDARASRRLREACECAKNQLSTHERVPIHLDALCEGVANFDIVITREKFEELCKDLFESTLALIDRVLGEAHVSKESVDQVVVISGCSRIPKVQSMLQAHFDKRPDTSLDPEEATAMGAAMQAAILAGVNAEKLKDFKLHESAPAAVGIELVKGTMHTMVKRCAAMPARGFELVTTDLTNQDTVHIRVFEGSAPSANGNTLLATLKLDKIAPAERTVPQIEVCYDIRDGGKMMWTVRNLETNQSQETCIDGVSLTCT